MAVEGRSVIMGGLAAGSGENSGESSIPCRRLNNRQQLSFSFDNIFRYPEFNSFELSLDREVRCIWRFGSADPCLSVMTLLCYVPLSPVGILKAQQCLFSAPQAYLWREYREANGIRVKEMEEQQVE